MQEIYGSHLFLFLMYDNDLLVTAVHVKIL